MVWKFSVFNQSITCSVCDISSRPIDNVYIVCKIKLVYMYVKFLKFCIKCSEVNVK